VAELVYDAGLVIHNATPGAVPRGDGRDSDLRAFSARFPAEDAGGVGVGLVVGLTTIVLAATGWSWSAAGACAGAESGGGRPLNRFA